MRRAITLVLLFCAGFVYGGGGRTAYDFVKVQVGERACSMAGAFTAIADDNYSIYWNPAGAVQLKGKALSLSHTDFIAGIQIEHLSFISPLNSRFALGAGINTLHAQDDYRDSGGNALGTFSNTASNISLLASYELGEGISVGGVLKGLSEQIADETTNGVSFDAGVLCRISGLNIGLTAHNLGSQINYGGETVSLPASISLGIGVTGIEKGLISADIDIPSDGAKAACFGGEYNAWKTLYVRAGYKLKEGGNILGGLDGLSMGVGFDVNRNKINYAMTPYGEYGYIHRISFNRIF